MADEKNDISDEKEVKEVEDTTDPWRNQTKTISKGIEFWGRKLNGWFDDLKWS